MSRAIQRAGRHDRAVARCIRRRRRWERTEALLAEMRHALGGQAATVEGLSARVLSVKALVGGVEVCIELDDGSVTLRMGHEDARGLLDAMSPPGALFAMVANVMRAKESEERAS